MKNKEGYADPTAGNAMRHIEHTKWLEEKHGIKVGQKYTLYFQERVDDPENKAKIIVTNKKRVILLELYERFVLVKYVQTGYRETFYYDDFKRLIKPPKEGEVNARRRR